MQQYIDELDEAARQVEADTLQAVRDEEARRVATLSKLAQADAVERAKRVLMNEKKHCRSERVAPTLFALAAVEAPAAEVQAAAAACAWGPRSKAQTREGNEAGHRTRCGRAQGRRIPWP